MGKEKDALYYDVSPVKLVKEIKNVFKVVLEENNAPIAMEVDPPARVSMIPSFVPRPVAQFSKPISSSNGVVNFSWDPEACAQNISLSENNMACFLMETGFCFRSVVANTGFMGGIAYWEIHADNRTENELKIGIVTKKNFNLNTVTIQ